MTTEEIGKLAKIQGIENLTIHQIQDEIQKGGKFVRFPYCISVIVMTHRNSSEIYFIKSGQSAFSAGLEYFLLSLFLGWWGIPFGPILTVNSIYHYLRGGKNVTEETIQYLLNPPAPFYDYCPGCSYFAYEKGFCTKHAMALVVYPEKFNQFCNGLSFERIPILLPTVQCYVCGTILGLYESERKSQIYTCTHCKHEYNFNIVEQPNQRLKLT